MEDEIERMHALVETAVRQMNDAIRNPSRHVRVAFGGRDVDDNRWLAEKRESGRPIDTGLMTCGDDEIDLSLWGSIAPPLADKLCLWQRAPQRLEFPFGDARSVYNVLHDFSDAVRPVVVGSGQDGGKLFFIGVELTVNLNGFTGVALSDAIFRLNKNLQDVGLRLTGRATIDHWATDVEAE